jgi:hypothetical protein
MLKVATRFHVSDVAVAKACRRHKIPLPGRGYWARVAAGQQVEKSPLIPRKSDGWKRLPRYGDGRRSSVIRQAGVWPLEKLHLPDTRFRLRDHFNVLNGSTEGATFAVAIVFARCD